MNDNKMTPVELRATWGLGTVFPCVCWECLWYYRS